jgi:hypothetical protein
MTNGARTADEASQHIDGNGNDPFATILIVAVAIAWSMNSLLRDRIQERTRLAWNRPHRLATDIGSPTRFTFAPLVVEAVGSSVLPKRDISYQVNEFTHFALVSCFFVCIDLEEFGRVSNMLPKHWTVG